MKEQFDIIIIGAGVVGLAIAQAVTAGNLRVALLEKMNRSAAKRARETAK